MIGHGTLGLRDSIPTFRDITGRSNARGYPLVECGFGAEIPAGTWTQHNGNTWKARANFIIGGILRDIVSVDTSAPARHTVRKETLALCISSTVYSYFADTENARVPQEYWDQGGPPPGFDSWGTFFDVFPPLDLYLNLGGIDPNTVAVVAELGFFYSPRAVRHPVLGEDLLVNGSLDSESGGEPTGWTMEVFGATPPTLFRDANVFRGAASQGFLCENATENSFRRATQGLSLTSGASSGRYRFSGAYYTADHVNSSPVNTDQDNARAWIGLQFYDGVDLREVKADGISYTLATTIPPIHLLTPTRGRWRRFLFEFIWPTQWSATFTPFFGIHSATSGANGRVWFDDVRFQRVFRYHDYEDRLTEASVPELEMAASDIFLGRRTVGLGGISLVNGIGERSLSRQIGGLLLARRPVKVVAAGVVDGIDLVREDCRAQFFGRINTVDASDNQVGFGIEDPMSDLLDTKLPLRKVNLTDNPTAPLAEVGRVRPILLGVFSTLPMGVGRISKDASTGYGMYEIADTQRAPNGIYAISSVRVYRTVEELTSNPAGGRILTAGTEYSESLAAATVSIVKDVRDIWRDAEGKDLGGAFLDFDIGGANIAASIYGGAASQPHKVASDMSTQWSTLSGVTITWTYSETTHQFSASRPGALTLNLRIKTGPNTDAAKKLWTAMGYNADADLTGAGPHVSAVPVFTDVDKDHIIAVEGIGYRDDAAGTYSGAANFYTNQPSEHAHMILRALLQVNPAKIRAVEFQYATLNATLPYSMSIVNTRLLLTEQETARIILQRLAQGAMADLYVDGDGMWHWAPLIDVPKVNTALLVHITDEDILPGSWSVYQRRSDTYQAVEVEYLKSAASGPKAETVQVVWDPNVPMKYGRDEVLRLRSYHDDVGWYEYPGGPLVHGAIRLSRIIAKMSAAPPLAVTLMVRHRLSDHVVNGRFLLSRRDAFTDGGAMTSVLMRIIRITHNFFSGVGTVVAVKDIPMGTAGGQP